MAFQAPAVTTSVNSEVRAQALAVLSISLSSIATFVFIVLFAILWAPFYLTGSEGQLFLYPIVLFVAVVVVLVALTGAVVGVIGIVLRAAGRVRVAWAGAVLGAAITLLAFPALWFGNAPSLLFN